MAPIDESPDREAPPMPPPQRRLDVADAEGIADLVVEGPDRSLLKSRDFPEVQGLDVGASDVRVVLFDAYSRDSFAACWAAREALGAGVHYEGVDRATTVEDLAVEVRGKVVAMVGVCWSLEAMHDLVMECEWLFILETHESVVLELSQCIYPCVVPILDPQMCAASLAWNFFLPGAPVPPLIRAMEDAELGRSALRGASAFARGYDEAVDVDMPFGECAFRDEAFQRLELLLDGGGRATIERAIELGNAMKAEEEIACREAVGCYKVRTLRAFPAYLCAVVEVASESAGRVAEHLAAHLAAQGGEKFVSRAVAATYEVRGRRVRVQLRSAPEEGGADVAEVASTFQGFGRRARAFFTVALEEWEDLWAKPETVLWDVAASSPHCLQLRRGDEVTILHRGERFKESPADEWSWGSRTSDPLVEGWIPTLAHTLLLATRSEKGPGGGVLPLEEGDLLIAYGQRGEFVWAAPPGSDRQRAWYPRSEGLLQPVCPAHVRTALCMGVRVA